MSSSNTNEPHYVSVEQASEMLSVSSKTVRNWIAAGLLPAFEAGPKLLRINILDIRAFCRPSRPKTLVDFKQRRSEMTLKARTAADRQRGIKGQGPTSKVTEE